MSKATKEDSQGPDLRLVQDSDKRLRPRTDPEMKALLDDLKRRYRVMHERLDDPPDAA